MLPDFPEVKKFYQESLDQMLRRFLKSDPLLSQVNEHSYTEGLKNSIANESEEETHSEMKEIGEEIRVSTQDIVDQGPAAFIEHYKKLAATINQRRTQMMLQMVEEGAKKVGNTLSRKGQPFNPDHFLMMLEKVIIPFDDEGNPHLPVLVGGQKFMEEIRDKIPEWEADPLLKAKFDEVIKKKKAEWDDRESYRKLVD